jgi:competence protein ComEC
MKKRLNLLLILLALVFALGSHTQAAQSGDLNQPQPAASPLNIYALDIGQGDSLLIVSPTGKTVLIDAGDTGNSKTILNALDTHAGGRKIDLFIASHPHQDHIGSAVKVFKASTLTSVLDSGFPYTTDTYQNYLETIKAKGAKFILAAPGQHFDIGGGVVITVLSPIKPYFKQNQLHSGTTTPNANSVVVRLDYNKFSMIFTGDAEGETESRMIAKKENLKATILKVGHHGSRNATSDAFLLKVKPGSGHYLV